MSTISWLVEFSEVLNHIDGHKRPIVEAEKLLNAHYMLKYGVTEINDKEGWYHVSALCLQSSDIHGKPHDINLNLQKNGKFLDVHCSCEAGINGKCKHAVALLLLLTRSNRLEEWSVTDQPCSWSSKELKSYVDDFVTSLRVTDFCHLPKVHQETPLPPIDENDEEFQILMRAFPKSVMCKDLHGRGTMIPLQCFTSVHPEICKMITDPYEFLDEVEDLMLLSSLDQNIINYYNEYIRLDERKAKEISANGQNNISWKRSRKLRITASSVYSLFAFKGDDWNRKLQNLLYPTFKGNSATKYGQQFEQMSLKLFHKQSGCKGELIKSGLVVNVRSSWLGFSPDGFYKETDKPLVLLEVKCPVQGKTKGMIELLDGLKYLERKSSREWRLKKKHAYFFQIQCALVLSQLKLAKLIILCKKEKKVAIIDVKYDENFCSNLIPVLRKIYFTHFLNFLYNNNVQ